MKKTLLSIAAFLTIGMSTLLAKDGIINKQTAASFNKQFAKAVDVSWQKQDDYRVATFVLNGRVLTAYFNMNARLIAVVQNVLPDHLPASLTSILKNQYNGYWISGLSQEVAGKQSYFRITVENSDETVEMKSLKSTDWVVEKRIVKTIL